MDATFDSAAEGLVQMGASVDERELVALLTRHGEQEGALLERYQRFAQDAASPAVRYLVRLILADEHRHHQLLSELANTIAWGWSDNSPVPATPEMHPMKEPSGELLAETRSLLAAEEDDWNELRRLRKKLRAYEETTLWPLIIELMMLDTEKHATILQFISRHAR